MDYFGARFDASSFGRFMTPDPKPALSKLLVNPQDLNLYVYTINNPLKYKDPDGRDWETAWNDLKTFVNSLHTKFSGGLGLEHALVKVGSLQAHIGAAVKTSAELGGKDYLVQNSVSAQAGLAVQIGKEGKSKFGEDIGVTKVTATVQKDLSVTGPEPMTAEKTDSLNIIGGSTSSSGDDRRWVLRLVRDLCSERRCPRQRKDWRL